MRKVNIKNELCTDSSNNKGEEMKSESEFHEKENYIAVGGILNRKQGYSSRRATAAHFTPEAHRFAEIHGIIVYLLKCTFKKIIRIVYFINFKACHVMFHLKKL